MKITETKLPGVFLIEPKVFGDSRGYFFESFNQKRFAEATGIEVNFVQDNQSFSTYGVLRGLHYQKAPYAQAKLVRVLKGKVLDVAVDIRNGSPTFGKSYTVELSHENNFQLFIPRGFAHGFVVLSETAEFFYKCDNFYEPQYEAGISFHDKSLDIDWQVPLKDAIISEKDRKLPFIQEADNNFIYNL